jgi:uncharacterized protein (DUF342 family)
MLKTTVTISSTSDEAARIEGALKLSVEPDEVTVEPIDKDTYDVSMMNAPGQFDIVIIERHMVATLKIITPPVGNGKPVAVQDIEKALADLKIVYGINSEVIENIVSEVAETGSPRENMQIATGEPARDGVDARIEYKFRLNGEDPETADISRQSSKLDAAAVRKEMFSADDVLAIKIPPQKPVNGCTVTGDTLLGQGQYNLRRRRGCSSGLCGLYGWLFVCRRAGAGFGAQIESLSVRPSAGGIG